MRSKQSGFTLIEIAIVLVIIGLLLGGVLKGQELITQAKIKNVANDLNGIAVAIYGYQDRYKRLPADDPGRSRWTVGGTALAADATNGGNNSVQGAYESTTNTDETRMFWVDLRMAGFVAGSTATVAEASSQPLNAAGGIVGVQTAGLGLTGTVVCAGSLPTKIAQALDSQMDDGNALTGSVRGMLDATPPTTLIANAAWPGTAANYADNGTNLYVVCKNI